MGKPDIRISNTERDTAVMALGEHLSTGRLDMSEYEERCGQAAAARTRGELEALFVDLPAPHPDLSSATSPGQVVKRKAAGKPKPIETPASRFFATIGALAGSLGIPAAIMLTIFLGAWWVFFPVIGTMIVAGGLADACKKKPAG
jgi:DUF1707 SHOCT-like domain